MSTLALNRHGSELLDDLAADPRQVRESLRSIQRANRFFGGWPAVRFGLAKLLTDRARQSLTLLDVGTGMGDLPFLARRWAARADITLTPIGLERQPTAARVAYESGLPTMRACGGALPVRDRGVDVVLVSQVAHHLDRSSIIQLIHECNRVARIGVVMADLRRSLLAQIGYAVGSRLLGFDRWSVTDGGTSIQRGFTAKSLLNLVREAGVHGTVLRRPGARLVAWWSIAP